MKVELLKYTEDPDLVCARAAYSTVSKAGATSLENEPREKLEKILRKVISSGHHSVVEHAYFTFSLEGLSRACTHQLVRHRIASYSQQSQRYVKFDDLEYVTPPKIQGEMKEKYDAIMGQLADGYKELLNSNIPAEDARYLLPNAATSNIVVSMNARALLNFFSLRCCLRAQWEIQKVANLMLAEAKKAAPIIFENAGPLCKSEGRCIEDKQDCPLYPK